MPTTIDSLAIEINAEAVDVANKIDSLATKMGKLATSIGSVNRSGLVNISGGLKKIKWCNARTFKCKSCKLHKNCHRN